MLLVLVKSGLFHKVNRKIGIELPNVSDPEKAKAHIGTAAILELKPVYDFAHTKEELIRACWWENS